MANRSIGNEEKTRARELVKIYGQNSSSYLALEDDKKLFFGKNTDGVIAYGIVGKVMVVCGDPICAPDDFNGMLAEFKQFCDENALHCVFMLTNGTFLGEYGAMGYNYVKAGEEALFSLNEYNIAGGKRKRMRRLVNNANSSLLTTHEYKPSERRCDEIEAGLLAVLNAWLAGKKSGQLQFSVGTLGLDEPLDKRYFYIKDDEGKIIAFNMFTPFAGMNGYLAEMTCRMPDAPLGVTEKLTYDGFMVFKDEGMEWGSLGPAPLANIRKECEKANAAVKLLEFVYERCNRFFGFKNLYRAKKKYYPTEWIPKYFVYSAKTITPRLAYAIVKIQNQGGVTDFLLSGLRWH